MASIYELKQEFMTLWDILEDEAVEDEALIDAFQTATEDLTFKLENCCKYIKNTQAEIKGLKEEEERLYARRKTKEKAIERLKKLMQEALIVAGEKKIPCGTFTVSIQKNPEKVVLDTEDKALFPEKYLIPQEPNIDTKQIKEDLKAGDHVLIGIAHLEQTESLRIR